jgi:hypothetical protein
MPTTSPKKSSKLVPATLLLSFRPMHSASEDIVSLPRSIEGLNRRRMARDHRRFVVVNRACSRRANQYLCQAKTSRPIWPGSTSEAAASTTPENSCPGIAPVLLPPSGVWVVGYHRNSVGVTPAAWMRMSNSRGSAPAPELCPRSRRNHRRNR